VTRVLAVSDFLHHCIQTSNGAYPASYPKVNGGSFPRGTNGQDIIVTTHLHLVPRLRVSGSIPPPPNIFIAWYLSTGQL